MSKVKLDIPDWEIDLDHEFAVWFVDSKRHIKLWEKIKGSFPTRICRGGKEDNGTKVTRYPII